MNSYNLHANYPSEHPMWQQVWVIPLINTPETFLSLNPCSSGCNALLCSTCRQLANSCSPFNAQRKKYHLCSFPCPIHTNALLSHQGSRGTFGIHSSCIFYWIPTMCQSPLQVLRIQPQVGNMLFTSLHSRRERQIVMYQLPEGKGGLWREVN